MSARGLFRSVMAGLVLQAGAGVAAAAPASGIGALAALESGEAAPQAISIVQARRTVVASKMTVTGVIPIDDTMPQSNEGMEIMTVQITPTSPSSILMVEVLLNVAELSDVQNNIVAAVFRDGGSDAIAAGVAAAFQSLPSYGITPLTFTHFLAAGSTSPTTFRLRLGGDGGGGSVQLNSWSSVPTGLGGVLRSYLQVVELAVQ